MRDLPQAETQPAGVITGTAGGEASGRRYGAFRAMTGGR